MSLLATAIPLIIYAVGFQTIVYLLLPIASVPPGPARHQLGGGGMVVVAAVWFGPTTIGLAGPDGGLLASWGSATWWR